jgi:hypothetical protein
MGDLKSDLLLVIEMAEAGTGHLPPDERQEVVTWLASIRRRVNAGNEFDRLRRRLRAARDALAAVGDLVGKALLVDADDESATADEDEEPTGSPPGV